jgi:AraC family transcriptional regulator of arabinose operon
VISIRYISAFQIPESGLLDDRGFLNDEVNLAVNSAGYYEFDDSHGIHHRPHGRHDFYLSYNRAGTMICRIRDKEVQVGAGDVFIYKPYEEHYYGPNSITPISNYWMHFSGFEAASLLKDAKLWDDQLYTIGQDPILIQLFENIINELMEKKPRYEWIAASLAQQVLFHISRKMEYRLLKGTAAKKSAEISESLKYIHNHYANPLTLQVLADKSKYSLSRFSHLFKVQIGMSPQQYLIHYRLQKAKELLLYSELNIKQISQCVGIEDQLYFSRLFKKHEAIAPMEYKKRSLSRLDELTKKALIADPGGYSAIDS